MLQEDFIPQKWFNSIFSELNNYELVQYPTERDWFFSETATAKKRDWLYTEQDLEWNYVWKTDAEIKWKIIVGWVMFLWDKNCNVYRFEKDSWNYTLTKIFSNVFGNIWLEDWSSLYAEDMSWQFSLENSDSDIRLFEYDMYGRRVKQKALCISYLNKLNKEFTVDKTASTNDDWNWNTIIAANEAWIFTDWSTPWDENMLAYYVYFPSSSSSQVRWQIRQIVEIPSWENWKQAYLSQMFYSEPTDWLVDEPCEVYEWIEDVIVFNNIRNSAGQVLTLWISNSEAHFRDLGWIDIEMFEWRLWMINSYATSVWASLASWEYEMLDPNTVRGSSIDSRWQKMDSLVLIKNYLLVNMENSMSVIWKMAVDDNEVDPIYNINSIINGESAITPDAIFFKSWLYFVNTDTMFEWGDVVAVSSNMIYWETTNQWAIVQTWLDKISYWDYVRAYWIWRMRIIQYIIDGKTQMLVYDDLYEWWMPRDYPMEIYDKFEKFYDERVIWVWDKICFKRWDSDLWETIKCKVTIIGSKNYINSLFSIKKIKIWLWFYDNIQHFKIKLDLWYTVYEWHIQKDAEWVEYLTWSNIAWQQWDWLWVMPVWIVPFGWWDVESWLVSYIWKIWLIWVPIGKKCDYYKITLENLNNDNLNLTGISVLTEWWNTYITPANNVF